jgi:hypothetical protein
MTAAGTHVVFGTGPAARAVADALIDQGSRVAEATTLEVAA